MWALHALLALAAAEADFPYFEPVQLIRPTEDHQSVRVAPSVSAIQNLRNPISVVSVVGPYHSGKSFLLNALTGGTGAFKIGRMTSPETMGVWVCRTNYTATDGSEIWLMDSEGFFGPGISEDYDAKIFTLATLLGSVVVYNTVKIIDQHAVNLLEMLTRRAKLFRTRSKSVASGGSDQPVPGFLHEEHFPSLVWVVEDFVQDLSGKSPQDWLDSYLKSGTDSETYFSKVFSSLSVHTLFLPATTEEALQDLSRVSYDGLTPQFHRGISSLRDHVMKTARSKPYERRAMTGQDLAHAVHFVARSLEEGFFPELPSLWESWKTQVARNSLEDARKWFSDQMGQIDGGVARPVADVAEEGQRARKEALHLYETLIADFDVQSELHYLGSLLSARFDETVAHFQDKVRGYVAERTHTMKDELHATLNKEPMPVDPTQLAALSSGESDALTRTLAAEVERLARPDETALAGWPRVALPTFDVAPDAALSAELRGICDAARRENDRLILHDLKVATTAARKAVDETLRRLVGVLQGDAALQDLARSLELAASGAFDASLPHTWYSSSEQYAKHQELVTDERSNEFERYKTRNGELTREFLIDLVAKGVALYEDVIYQIERSGELPTMTDALWQKHESATTAAVQALETEAAAVLDTAAFQAAKERLNLANGERFKRLETKNIQLWKVHSDEATSCGAKKNADYLATCGIFNYRCVNFWLFPRGHRHMSRRHLMECFETAKVDKKKGSMPAAMRDSVFEVWYSTDLAQEANSNGWQFFWGCAVALLAAVASVYGLGVLPKSLRWQAPSSAPRPSSPARSETRPAFMSGLGREPSRPSHIPGSAMPFGGSVGSGFSGASSTSGYGNLDPPRSEAFRFGR